MSDRDALLAAIRALPDEDTPRLIFADYLEENGEGARAAFIRAQVEHSRTLPWEPFAVRCKWRQPEVVSGRRFIKELPPSNQYAYWADEPFRRGFGWALFVRSVGMWAELAEPLFEIEPIGQLHFWYGTLDDWVRLASSRCVQQFRDLTFHSNPIEPLWALRDKPAVAGVTDLRFLRASGAGMPEVIEDLVQSALGRTIRGLHFHAGYESIRELIDAINTGGPLQRLSFSVMGITGEYLRQLLEGGAAATLEELHLRDELPGSLGLMALAELAPKELLDVTLSNVGIRPDGLESLSRSERLANLRRLNLSRNSLTPRATKVLSLSRSLSRLRSLDLSKCHIGDKGVRHLTHAKFWPNLVELDLRGNTFSSPGIRHLLDAPRPPDLTALVLNGESLGAEGRHALTRKYGDAVVFAAPEARA